MYNFKMHLRDEEEILYESKAEPNKGTKNIDGIILVFILSLIIMSLLILSIKFKIGNGANEINLDWIIIFLGTLFFILLSLNILIYQLFLKKKIIADNEYCLTNLRIFKYESKKDNLIILNLADFDKIVSQNCKDGYGDVLFYKEKIDNITPTNLEDFKEFIKSEKINSISFESIKNPRKIVKLAKEHKENLKK